MKRQHETIKSRFVSDPRQCVPGRRFADLEGIWLFCSRKVIKPCEHLLSQWIWAHGQHCDHVDHKQKAGGRGSVNRADHPCPSHSWTIWLGQRVSWESTSGPLGSILILTGVVGQDSDQLQLSDNPRVMYSNMEFLQKQREKMLKWQKKRYDWMDGNSTKMQS